MELGVYVHIPFCVAKCRYCDFLSYPGRDDTQKDEYLASLMKETKIYTGLLPGFAAKTLYIGGGTPTCLTGGQLFRLLSFLKEELHPVCGAEITVEGNPGTLDEEKLQILKKGGCNRLSLGVQSFSPGELTNLGRIHTIEDVYNTYDLARFAGFENINLDLMYGLPNQELPVWRESLEKAVALRPEHISLYQLNLEEGTPFYQQYKQGLIQDFDQEKALAMYELAIETLAQCGYRHYEISNFALPGYESRHNQLYWLNQEYLGLGAGASGYLDRVRYRNAGGLAEYRDYLARGLRPVGEKEIIDRKLAMSETMFLGLRLLTGVKRDDFFRHYGTTLEQQYGGTIDKLKKQGLLQEINNSICLTRQGLYLGNQVFMEFLP